MPAPRRRRLMSFTATMTAQVSEPLLKTYKTSTFQLQFDIGIQSSKEHNAVTKIARTSEQTADINRHCFQAQEVREYICSFFTSVQGRRRGIHIICSPHRK